MRAGVGDVKDKQPSRAVLPPSRRKELQTTISQMRKLRPRTAKGRIRVSCWHLTISLTSVPTPRLRTSSGMELQLGACRVGGLNPSGPTPQFSAYLAHRGQTHTEDTPAGVQPLKPLPVLLYARAEKAMELGQPEDTIENKVHLGA